jgi:hypothetical protein
VCSTDKNHAAGGANGSIMVGMCVCLCLASKKPSKQEFFVPARMNFGVKQLILSQNFAGFFCFGGKTHCALNCSTS